MLSYPKGEGASALSPVEYFRGVLSDRGSGAVRPCVAVADNHHTFAFCNYLIPGWDCIKGTTPTRDRGMKD